MSAAEPVDPRLAEALEPVLADALRTAEVKLDVRADDWSDVPDQITAMVWQADGSGTGVSIMGHDSEVDRVVAAADQVQEIVVEALWVDGRSATWPECPAHPGGHPLKAARHSGAPTWLCPASGHAWFPIGALGAFGGVTAD